MHVVAIKYYTTTTFYDYFYYYLAVFNHCVWVLIFQCVSHTHSLLCLPFASVSYSIRKTDHEEPKQLLLKYFGSFDSFPPDSQSTAPPFSCITLLRQTSTEHVMGQMAFQTQAVICLWVMVGADHAQVPQPRWKTQKHTNALCDFVCVCVWDHLCMHVEWSEAEGGRWGILGPSWINEVTSMPVGENASAVGSSGQWTSVRCPGPWKSHTGRENTPRPPFNHHHHQPRHHTPSHWSSITALFWVILLSPGCLGIISFLHKKLCKSFHLVWWALGPLTWVDILIHHTASLLPLSPHAQPQKQTRWEE